MVTDDHETMRGPHATVSVDQGRTLRGRVGGGTGDEDRGVWLSAAGGTSQGFDYRFDEFADVRDGRTESIGRDGYLSHTLQAKGWVGDLTGHAFVSGPREVLPHRAPSTRSSATPAGTQTTSGPSGEIRYEPTLGENAQLFSRIYVDHYEYRGRFPYGAKYVYADFWKGTWLGVEPRLVAQTTDWLELTLGAETRQYFHAELFSWEFQDLAGAIGSLSDPPAGTTFGRQPLLDEQPTSQVYSGYGIAALSLGDSVLLSAGGRYDFYRTPVAVGDDFTTFNPRLALILKPGDRDVIKAMGGTAFRAPSPYEYLYQDGGATQVRARNLDPETIATAEIEYAHALNDVTSLTLATYFNQITDLMSTEDLPDQGVFRYAQRGGPDPHRWRRGRAEKGLASGMDCSLYNTLRSAPARAS